MSEARSPQVYGTRPKPADAAYDLAAPFYDNWDWQKFWRQHEYPIVLKFITEFIRQDRRNPTLLDVGCGTGWYLNKLKDITPNYFGIDISEGMLKIAKQRVETSRVIEDNIERFTFEDSLFDIILCTRVLSHVKNLEHVFSSFEKAISPGGIIIISDIHPQHNYKFTKLPYFDRSVYAETFKHTHSDMLKLLSKNGFFIDRGFEINTDGTIVPSYFSKNNTTGNKASGWVGMWRQMRKKKVKRKISVPRNTRLHHSVIG